MSEKTILISASHEGDLDQLEKTFKNLDCHIIKAGSLDESRYMATQYFPNIIVCAASNPDQEISYMEELRRNPSFKYMMTLLIVRGTTQIDKKLTEHIDDIVITDSDAPIPDNINKRVEWLLKYQRYRRQIEMHSIREGVLTHNLHSILGAITDGIILTDSEGTIETINPAAYEMLHLTSSATFLNVNRALLFKPKKQFTREPSFEINKDGKVIRGYNAFINGPNGTKRTLTVLRDITLARHLDQIKSDFISLVSHELRSPLTALSNILQIMEDDIENRSKEDRELIVIGQRNAKRLNSLINNLLDLSKIEVGKMQYNWEPSSLEGPISASMSSMELLGREKNITLFTDFLDASQQSYIDKTRIEQVFVNLINNAIKFSPKNGKVKIKVKKTTNNELPSSAAKELTSYPKAENYIHVSIEDEGPGILESDMDRLFEKFQQLENVDTRSAQGSGLGLAIARNIIQNHAGAIWAESEYGSGTTFHILLPEYSPRQRWFIEVNYLVYQYTQQGLPLTILGVSIPKHIRAKQEQLTEVCKKVCRREKDNFLLFDEAHGMTLIFHDLNYSDRKVVETRFQDEWNKVFQEEKAFTFTLTLPEEQHLITRLCEWLESEKNNAT